MGKFIIKYDIESKEFFHENLLGEYNNSLYISFLHGPRKTVVVKNFRFGYELFLNNQLIKYDILSEKTKYNMFNQKHITPVQMELKPDNDYSILFWVDNNGVKSQETFSFTSPRPEKEFDSWVWDSDNSEWKAPKPYPNDGKDYEWDEKNQQWVLEVDDT